VLACFLSSSYSISFHHHRGAFSFTSIPCYALAEKRGELTSHNWRDLCLFVQGQALPCPALAIRTHPSLLLLLLPRIPPVQPEAAPFRSPSRRLSVHLQRMSKKCVNRTAMVDGEPSKPNCAKFASRIPEIARC
jgi:hypothetical protein